MNNWLLAYLIGFVVTVVLCVALDLYGVKKMCLPPERRLILISLLVGALWPVILILVLVVFVNDLRAPWLRYKR